MGGWRSADNCGWQVRREQAAAVPRTRGRWSGPDIAVMVVAFIVHWELGLAFLGLKLWQQASGHQGSVFAFAREKWEGLVETTRGVFAGAGTVGGLGGLSGLGARSSGNSAFDAWRRAELDRIEAERAKLRAAERDFTAYREELLRAKDNEDFERFMRWREENAGK